VTGTADTGISQDLIKELLDLVGRALAPPGRVEEVERRPNDFSTKLSSEFVTLLFDGGPPLRLLVKKVVDDTEARRPSPPDREVRVYERLDGHRAFAAPRFIGTIGGSDPHLVLTAVEGWDLRYHAVDRWVLAARDLGRMHAALHEDLHELASDGALAGRRSEDNLAEARLAAAIVRAHEDQSTPALLGPLADGYAALAEELIGQPATLVHGDLAPKNVLIEESEDGERAVFVDWEWAAIGLGAFDLADLVNGLDPDDAARVIAAYVATASGTALPAEEDAATRCIELARLQRVLFRITRSEDWQVSTSQVTAWAREAASLYERLEGPS
jgi:Ser/Thr protein kinase RdoA (MazF antagonist)